jgi:hypothetical protein
MFDSAAYPLEALRKAGECSAPWRRNDDGFKIVGRWATSCRELQRPNLKGWWPIKVSGETFIIATSRYWRAALSWPEYIPLGNSIHSSTQLPEAEAAESLNMMQTISFLLPTVRTPCFTGDNIVMRTHRNSEPDCAVYTFGSRYWDDSSSCEQSLLSVRETPIERSESSNACKSETRGKCHAWSYVIRDVYIRISQVWRSSEGFTTSVMKNSIGQGKHHKQEGSVA